MELIDKILAAGNLTKACKEVVKNKGAGGVDKMPVQKLKQYLDDNRNNLCDSVRSGNYMPQPIRGKQIPKGNGKKRLLGIPTAIDRMLQQAVLRVVMPLYEPYFSDDSYGFRPNRNTIQAVAKALGYVNSGFQNIVEIDLIPIMDFVDFANAKSYKSYIGTMKLTMYCLCNCFTEKLNAGKPCAF